MTRALRAELIKLWRPRTITVAVLSTLVFTIGSAALVLAAVPSYRPAGFGPTSETLSRAGGGSEVFTTALSFAGFFVFVVFIGAFAIEFSRGTIRTMALRQPERLRLIVGKFLGLLTSAAVLAAGAEVVGWTAARLMARANGVDPSRWMSWDGLGAGVVDYGKVLFWVSGYALLGTMLGVLIRSVPIALAAGIAWAGPIEHVVGNAWSGAGRVFPGLLLEDLFGTGRWGVSAGRAFTTSAAYAVVTASVAALTFMRRDLT